MQPGSGIGTPRHGAHSHGLEWATPDSGDGGVGGGAALLASVEAAGAGVWSRTDDMGAVNGVSKEGK